MKRRPTWYTAEDARADRAARYGGDPNAPTERPGGVLAQFDGFCWVCDRTIVRLQSRVVPRKGGWCCISCGGADDE